jgi:hypothetical protein
MKPSSRCKMAGQMGETKMVVEGQMDQMDQAGAALPSSAFPVGTARRGSGSGGGGRAVKEGEARKRVGCVGLGR